MFVGPNPFLDTNDSTIIELAHNTMALLDNSSEHDNKYKIVEITYASAHVVSGMKYLISANIALSIFL